MTDELHGKQLELLKEIIPRLTRVAVLWNPPQPAHERQLKSLESAARALTLQIQAVAVRTSGDLDRAFAALDSTRGTAVLLLGSDLHTRNVAKIADLASKLRMPAMAASRRFAEAGGLTSYGANDGEAIRGAATYVDKILKGARPADLPVQQPTKFDLAVNLKTAKALGLTVPQSVLLRVDHVIE